jgi:hypothetical protein
MSSSGRKSKRLQEKKSTSRRKATFLGGKVILSGERSEERSGERSEERPSPKEKSKKGTRKKAKYVKCIFHPPGPGTVLSGSEEVTSETCAVCLGEVPTKPKERARTECGHLYCKECIIPWLSQSAKDVCPTCRGCSVPLKDGNGEEILYDKIPIPPPEVVDPPEFLRQQILQGGFDLMMHLIAIMHPPPPQMVLPRVPPVEEVRVRRRRR